MLNPLQIFYTSERIILNSLLLRKINSKKCLFGCGLVSGDDKGFKVLSDLVNYNGSLTPWVGGCQDHSMILQIWISYYTQWRRKYLKDCLGYIKAYNRIFPCMEAFSCSLIIIIWWDFNEDSTPSGNIAFKHSYYLSTSSKNSKAQPTNSELNVIYFIYILILI